MIFDLETKRQQSATPSGMIRIPAASKVDVTKTAGTKMETKSNALSWVLRISIAAVVIGGVGTVAGNSLTSLGAMTSGEISTLHAALFFATVWIVSSLRIVRLKALWRVGLKLTGMRGPSGNLLPRGPKARAAAGGSVSGAGTSGVS